MEKRPAARRTLKRSEGILINNRLPLKNMFFGNVTGEGEKPVACIKAYINIHVRTNYLTVFVFILLRLTRKKGFHV